MLRWQHLVNDEVQSSDNATWTLDLPEQGNLHALLIKARCTNGATSGRAVSIFDVVDNIEVIGHGQETLFNLIPEVIEKVHETMTGRPLYIDQNEAADAVQEGVFPVYFGRSMYDSNMYLPLGSVSIAQLRIAYSPSIAADGGFATGTTSFDVMALMSDGPDVGAYLGTLVTRELRNFTSAASGDVATEIVSRRRQRAVGIYAYEAAIADGVDITRVQFQTNSGQHRLFDADWDDFIHLNGEMYGTEIEHNFHAFLQDTETLATRLGDITAVNVTINEDVVIASDTFPVVNVDTIAGDTLTFNVSTATIAAGTEALTALTSDQDLLVSVRAKSPSYFGFVPLAYSESPDEWFDPAQEGKVETVLTQGAAGADVRIIAQELGRY